VGGSVDILGAVRGMVGLCLRDQHRLKLCPGRPSRSRILIAGDRDSGQRTAQVPGIVSGAYDDRIVPAILIIPPARGLQGNGEAILAIYEGNVAARRDLGYVRDTCKNWPQEHC
jgi:hypothetical protein